MERFFNILLPEKVSLSAWQAEFIGAELVVFPREEKHSHLMWLSAPAYFKRCRFLYQSRIFNVGSISDYLLPDSVATFRLTGGTPCLGGEVP